MSRIGRMPIAIPAGVTVDIAENNQVTVKGPKGTLERVLPAEMTITKEGEEVKVTRPHDLKKMKSLHGLTRTLINNMIIGVTSVEAGLYITAGTKITIWDKAKAAAGEPLEVVKGAELSGKDNILFIRNSVNGRIEARYRKVGIELNAKLHKN